MVDFHILILTCDNPREFPFTLQEDARKGVLKIKVIKSVYPANIMYRTIFMTIFWETSMEENVVQAASLDSRVVAAKQSESETEKLIEEFRPFLNARVTRYSSNADWDRREDLMSLAMMAFYEAIQKYDVDKGHFFPFVNRVVRARLIDGLRQLYKNEEQSVPLEEDDDEQFSSNSSAINEISMRFYDIQRRQESLAEEIEQFKLELASWGITLDELTRQSPKHRKLLETYKKTVSQVSQNIDIIQTIQMKRYFPVKAVAELTGLPRKNVERARTFILASLIIKLGDFDYLSDYVKDG